MKRRKSNAVRSQRLSDRWYVDDGHRSRTDERTRRELENEKSEEAWERKNDALRRLGLRTIPNPVDS